MLKKRNIFVAIFSLIFCFSMFFVNVSSNQEMHQNPAYAAGLEMPEFGGELEEGEDGKWSYNGEEFILTLNGVQWTEQLTIPSGLQIKIVVNGNDNSIIVEDDHAISSDASTSITFEGSGILHLSSGSVSVFSAGLANNVEFANDVGVKETENGEAIEPSSAVTKNEIWVYGLHTEHSYTTFSAANSVLTASCSCGHEVTGTISVADLDCGGTIEKSIAFSDNSVDASDLGLTETSFGYEYYKVNTKGELTGGEKVDNPTLNAGYYYMQATGTQGTPFEGLVLKCAFEVRKLQTTVIGEDKTTKYNATAYDLSQMFVFDENAGTKTYSIVAEGSTATGSISGNMLTITKCGVLNIKVTTSGNDNYSGSELTKALTIQRADLTVGYEEGQLHIFILDFVDQGGEEIPGYGWLENDDEHSIPEVRNNIGGGTVTMTYWTDEACTVPTTTEHGATATNGMPEKMGLYYIKAEIAESNLFNAKTITRELKIYGSIADKVDLSGSNITYKDLVDGKYDISKIFVIEEEYLSEIESIRYYYEINKDERIFLEDDTLFEITSVVDSENGDNYTFGVLIRVKENSLYVSQGLKTTLNISKTEIDQSKIILEDKYYDGFPAEPTILDNPYNGLVSVEYTTIYTPSESDGVPVNVGRYKAKIVIEETGFTKRAEKTVEFEILVSEIEIIWDEDNFVYNGQVQEISAYYLNAGNQVPLKVVVDKEFKNVYVGDIQYTYTATASFENGEELNYKLPDNNTKEYHMKPIEITAEIRGDFVFSGYTNYELGINIVSGDSIVSGEMPYTLSIYDESDLDEPIEITASTPVGKYVIVGECIDTNYNITFTGNGWFFVKNIIKGNYNGSSSMIEGWVWNEEPKTPSASAAAGKIEYAYYRGDEILPENLLAEKPTDVPGIYMVVATVEDEQSFNWAILSEIFVIDKATVNYPQTDTTVYTYDGAPKTYKIIDTDTENALHYTVGEHSFIPAGTYTVQFTINDFELYRWPDYEEVYEVSFVINKKNIEKPAADNRKFKYNGNPLTYLISASENYVVSDNVTQTDVATYKITVRLEDTNNTQWSDGTTDTLEYVFVINQNKIENPDITDSNGNKVNTKDVEIINVAGSGLSPDTSLKVEIANANDSKKIEKAESQLKNVLTKYDKIFKVTDITLLKAGDEVQPENKITLKMLIPEELSGAKFRLYHIHVDEEGNEVVSEVEYGKVDENGYIIFQTSELSSFAFVYEQTSLKSQITLFAVLSGVMFLILVAQIVLFILKKKKSKVLAAAAVPVFYVSGEVTSTITLGCVFGVLLLANIIMMIFVINAFRCKKAKKQQVEKQKEENVEVEKTEEKKVKAKPEKKKTTTVKPKAKKTTESSKKENKTK